VIFDREERKALLWTSRERAESVWRSAGRNRRARAEKTRKVELTFFSFSHSSESKKVAALQSVCAAVLRRVRPARKTRRAALQRRVRGEKRRFRSSRRPEGIVEPSHLHTLVPPFTSPSSRPIRRTVLSFALTPAPALTPRLVRILDLSVEISHRCFCCCFSSASVSRSTALTGWRKFEGERAVGEGGVGGARGGREGGLEGGEVVVEGRKEEGQRAWRFLLKCGGLGVR
jgi:hypothetical protein